MIDPRTQYILYKAQENALMAQIERNLAAQPRRSTEGAAGQSLSSSMSWVKAFVRTVLYRARGA